MVLRNSFYNMLGLGLPLVVAVVAIPVLIRSLGVEAFGILTIIWAVVSYFGLFDLGLGRAVTQQVAVASAAGDGDRLKAVVGTSIAMMGMLGVLAGVAVYLTAPLLARELTANTSVAEVTGALRWMALAMPAIVLTSGYRGILEALGRFGLVNAIRVPMGVFTFAGPLLVVWFGYPQLEPIAAVLVVGRLAAWLCHMVYALRALPAGTGHGAVRRDLVRPLIGLGGWMSVSNIVAPLMNYVDRFVIGIAASAAAVAYYATPQELVLRIGIIPGAVVAVLFPIFAADTLQADDARDRGQLRRYTLWIFAALLPLAAALFFGAETILSLWISPAFAAQATAILQLMAIAALASGLAQVPFTMLQGKGRADLTAKLHLVELPIYLAALWLAVQAAGPVGAAWAWLARIVADLLALWFLCTRQLNQSAEHSRHTEVPV